jgi:serine/threonine protein kinase/multisubunit Na+/H+ antiporter MnhF subunit
MSDDVPPESETTPPIPEPFETTGPEAEVLFENAPGSAHSETIAHSTPNESPPIRSFGNYEVIEEIARGGMGVVYRARHKRLNRTVALKMIRSGQFASGDDRARFNLEAEAAAKLDHPGITPIYEIGEFQNQPYFAMKLIEGGSLADRLNEYVGDYQKVARMVADIADAIHHAHQRGTLHRDLKPNNILIDNDGHPLVTDFGLAKITDHESGVTRTGAIMGTPGYMPPEQAASGKFVTAAADIYSLGAILFSLLTGRPPFQGDSVMETVMQVVNKDAPRPSSFVATIPIELELICLKCLARDPEQRYSSAAELAKDLERWLMGDPVSVRPPNLGGMAWKWFRENVALAGMIAAMGVVMAIFVSLIVLQLKFQNSSWIHTTLPSQPSPLMTELLSGHVSTWITTLPKYVSHPLFVLAIAFIPLSPCLLGAFTVWLTKPSSWAETTTFGLFAAVAFSATTFMVLGWWPLSDFLNKKVEPDLALMARQDDLATAQLLWKYPDLKQHPAPFSVLKEKIQQDVSLNAATELPRAGILYFTLILLVMATTSAAYRLSSDERLWMRIVRFVEISLVALLLYLFFMMFFSETVYADLSSHDTHDWLVLAWMSTLAAAWFLAAYSGWRWYVRWLFPAMMIGSAILADATDPDDRFETALKFVAQDDLTAAASAFDRRVRDRKEKNLFDVAYCLGLHARAGDLPGYRRTSQFLRPALEQIRPRIAIDALEVSLLFADSPVDADLVSELAVFVERFEDDEKWGSDRNLARALYRCRNGENEAALELLQQVESEDALSQSKRSALLAMVHHHLGDRLSAFDEYAKLEQAVAAAEGILPEKDYGGYRYWNHSYSLLLVYHQQAEALLSGGVFAADWKRNYVERLLTDAEAELAEQPGDPKAAQRLSLAKLLAAELSDETGEVATSEYVTAIDAAIQAFASLPSRSSCAGVLDSFAAYYERTVEEPDFERIETWLTRIEDLASDCRPELPALLAHDCADRLGEIANEAQQYLAAAKWYQRAEQWARDLPVDVAMGDRLQELWSVKWHSLAVGEACDGPAYLVRRALHRRACALADAEQVEPAMELWQSAWDEFPGVLPIHGIYIERLARHDEGRAAAFVASLRTEDAASWHRNRLAHRSLLHVTHPDDEEKVEWLKATKDHLQASGVEEAMMERLIRLQHWRAIKRRVTARERIAFERQLLSMESPGADSFIVKGVRQFEFSKPFEVRVGTACKITTDDSAYCSAVVRSPRDQTCNLVIGNENGIALWLNQELVHEKGPQAGFHPRSDSMPVKLVAGENHLLLRFDESGTFGIEFESDDGWPAELQWVNVAGPSDENRD